MGFLTGLGDLFVGYKGRNLEWRMEERREHSEQSVGMFGPED